MIAFLPQNWNTDQGFENLFKTLYTPMYRYALGLLTDDMQAEEVVQDVFLKLWQQKDSINITTNLKSYLYRAVHNQSMNILNHEKVKEKYQAYVKAQSVQFAETPLQSIHTKELKAHIAAALLKVPEKCRAIFHLSRQEDLSYKAIAEQLDISIKTVENQMSKALRILRAELSDYLPFWLIPFFMIVIN